MKARDKIKQSICIRDGITLLVVPYWWDRSIGSIARSIQIARPDLVIPTGIAKGDPIPSLEPIIRPEKGESQIFW